MIKLEDSLQNVSSHVTQVKDKGRADKVFQLQGTICRLAAQNL